MSCGNCERLNVQLKQLSATAKEEEKIRHDLKEQISASKKQLDGVQTKTATKNPSKFWKQFKFVQVIIINNRKKQCKAGSALPAMP